jgi:3-phosphoshikimate 1-carboxyvinyltransferase
MRVGGALRAPGDKSVTHRALITAALAHSRAKVSGALTAHDARSTARALRQLGVEVGPLRAGCAVTVEGRRWRAPEETIHCGNSGTTARLLLGALAGQGVSARLSGDASLRRRPMRRVTTPLRAMGAVVEEEAGDALPLRVSGGQLRPFSYHTPVASAQLKSAILFAGVSGGVPVTVSEPVRSRDHTERMFRHLGFDLRVSGTTVVLEGTGDRWPRLPDFELEVPGDASSAAYLVGAALLADEGELLVERVGVNPTRVGFLEVIGRMGGRVEQTGRRDVSGEPVADLLVRPGTLAATDVGADEIPSLIDEVPLLAVLAARAEGETRFRSVGELRVKESDRLGLIAGNLRAVGVDAAVDGDDLVVVGGDAPPRGAVETARDHRLTMAFAVLGSVPGADVRLSETASAGVSYPGFWDDLERMRQDD